MIDDLKAIWKWMAEKAWPVVKAAWKLLLVLSAMVVAVLVGGKVIRAILGKVDVPRSWNPIPGNPTHVVVAVPGKPSVVVELPRDPQGKQVTSGQVSAVAYQPGYSAAVVEVKIEAIDRR